MRARVRTTVVVHGKPSPRPSCASVLESVGGRMRRPQHRRRTRRGRQTRAALRSSLARQRFPTTVPAQFMPRTDPCCIMLQRSWASWHATQPCLARRPAHLRTGSATTPKATGNVWRGRETATRRFRTSSSTASLSRPSSWQQVRSRGESQAPRPDHGTRLAQTLTRGRRSTCVGH